MEGEESQVDVRVTRARARLLSGTMSGPSTPFLKDDTSHVDTPRLTRRTRLNYDSDTPVTSGRRNRNSIARCETPEPTASLSILQRNPKRERTSLRKSVRKLLPSTEEIEEKSNTTSSPPATPPRQSDTIPKLASKIPLPTAVINDTCGISTIPTTPRSSVRKETGKKAEKAMEMVNQTPITKVATTRKSTKLNTNEKLELITKEIGKTSVKDNEELEEMPIKITAACPYETIELHGNIPQDSPKEIILKQNKNLSKEISEQVQDLLKEQHQKSRNEIILEHNKDAMKVVIPEQNKDLPVAEEIDVTNCEETTAADELKLYLKCGAPEEHIKDATPVKNLELGETPPIENEPMDVDCVENDQKSDEEEADVLKQSKKVVKFDNISDVTGGKPLFRKTPSRAKPQPLLIIYLEESLQMKKKSEQVPATEPAQIDAMKPFKELNTDNAIDDPKLVKGDELLNCTYDYEEQNKEGDENDAVVMSDLVQHETEVAKDYKSGDSMTFLERLEQEETMSMRSQNINEKEEKEKENDDDDSIICSLVIRVSKDNEEAEAENNIEDIEEPEEGEQEENEIPYDCGSVGSQVTSIDEEEKNDSYNVCNDTFVVRDTIDDEEEEKEDDNEDHVVDETEEEDDNEDHVVDETEEEDDNEDQVVQVDTEEELEDCEIRNISYTIKKYQRVILDDSRSEEENQKFEESPQAEASKAERSQTSHSYEVSIFLPENQETLSTSPKHPDNSIQSQEVSKTDTHDEQELLRAISEDLTHLKPLQKSRQSTINVNFDLSRSLIEKMQREEESKRKRLSISLCGTAEEHKNSKDEELEYFTMLQAIAAGKTKKNVAPIDPPGESNPTITIPQLHREVHTKKKVKHAINVLAPETVNLTTARKLNPQPNDMKMRKRSTAKKPNTSPIKSADKENSSQIKTSAGYFTISEDSPKANKLIELVRTSAGIMRVEAATPKPK